MSYFDYPLDTKLLRRKKLAIKRELSSKDNLIEKRIAVLGGSTTNDVVDMLELFLLYHGIKASFYQSEYGQYWQDAMFGSPELDEFNPDVVFIHTTWRNIESFPQMSDSKEAVVEKLEGEFARFEHFMTSFGILFFGFLAYCLWECDFPWNESWHMVYRVIIARDDLPGDLKQRGWYSIFLLARQIAALHLGFVAAYFLMFMNRK